MAKIKPAGTARGLRTQENRLNLEITIYNLALDKLETTGIDHPNRSISDPFTPLEEGVYDTLHQRLNAALQNRQVVQKALTAIGMQTHPAALDNRR